MRRRRREQLAYSASMPAMLDEPGRRRKAAKILAVLLHATGRQDLNGLAALDVGCSAGFVADELALSGAETHGVDIDEPGIAAATQRFGGSVEFHLAPGDHLPFPDHRFDVVVFNHIYEHVVDPEAVVREIHRVLAPGGVLYLGLGNRLGIIEPHYRLPFLSWLPDALADRYVRIFHRADEYHERFLARGGLRRLFAAFDVWDYTLPVLADAAAFSGDDVVPRLVGRIPSPLLGLTLPLVPTYIWVAFNGPARPLGPTLAVSPRHL